MTKKIANVVEELNQLAAAIGLQRLAKKADVVTDPGTAQPAEQEADRSQIQSAATGAQAAENSAAVKEQVMGQPIDAAKPADASKTPENKSAPENITTATDVGEDPAVEKDYSNANAAGDYPGTTHPADPNKQENNTVGKSASDKELIESADFILHELAMRKQASVEDLTMDNAFEKLGAAVLGQEGMTKTAAEKKTVGEAAAVEFIQGYVKSAGLVGELTADFLDGMIAGIVKKSEGEPDPEVPAEEVPAEEPPAEEMPAEAIPAEALAGEAGGEGGGAEDPQAQAAGAAILQAAEQVAAQLGVEPKDVLEAALAAEGETGEGGETPAGLEEAVASGAPPMEVAASFRKLALARLPQIKTAAVSRIKKAAMPPQLADALAKKKGKKAPAAAAPAAPAAAPKEEEEDDDEKEASAKELETLRKQAEELKSLKESLAKDADSKAFDSRIQNVVNSALNAWWMAKESELKTTK